MACVRFARELKDHALGAPLGTVAAAHLAVCSACQALLVSERRLVSAIDGAIAQAGSVRPAVEFPVRLREIHARVPRAERRVWRLAAAVAGVAAIAVLAARVGRHSTPEEIPAAPPTAALAAARPLPAARPAAPAPRAATARVPTAARVRRDRSGAASDFEVLVPAGQPEVIARLLTSLQVQEADVASRLIGQTAARVRVEPTAEAQPVRVAPILINAVDVPEMRALEPLLSN